MTPHFDPLASMDFNEILYFKTRKSFGHFETTLNVVGGLVFVLVIVQKINLKIDY